MNLAKYIKGKARILVLTHVLRNLGQLRENVRSCGFANTDGEFFHSGEISAFFCFIKLRRSGGKSRENIQALGGGETYCAPNIDPATALLIQG
jgi:hypothetical protein